MVFTTHNELLVAQEFVSSFQADATEYDESKVGAIVKGRTTRAEVLALLGRPNGEAIYPVIKTGATGPWSTATRTPRATRST